ncbi:MAG: VanZ family protein [Flavobacteriales bacterium]
MKKQQLHRIPFVLWLIIVTILSGFPGNKIPEQPFLNFDKVVHVGIYLMISVTLCFALFAKGQKNNSLKINLLIVFFGVFYGGFMELLQHYIFINRSGNWYDFFANAIGATIGVIIYPFVIKLLPLKR